MEEYQDIIIEVDGEVEMDVRMKKEDITKILKLSYKLAKDDMPWWDRFDEDEESEEE